MAAIEDLALIFYPKMRCVPQKKKQKFLMPVFSILALYIHNSIAKFLGALLAMHQR